MLWINSSKDTIKVQIDLGKGRQLIPVLPYQTIEFDVKYTQALSMEAPQLIPYIEPIIEAPIETPAVKRGRKPKGN
jgi:hypothetical protein